MNNDVLKYGLLSTVQSPDDLKGVSPKQLPELIRQTREFLVEKVSEQGGHLASNLGVVELTVAIHRVFDCPNDHVIFDVGHQSYVHKMFTGRRENFDTLRQNGGLSGFPRRDESPYDAFGTGHSSTSLSSALGFATADELKDSDAYTVCVVGDGAFTGGMIHEALNNCKKNMRLVIILNENEMSISKNIGRFAKSISRLRARRGYYKTKFVTGKILSCIPLIGKPTIRFIQRIKRRFKDRLYGSNYFEDMGLYYFGPVDGNDEGAVESLLRAAKNQGKACVVHVKTKKGMGYQPAELNPGAFHGLSPRDKVTHDDTFSTTFGDALCNLAERNDRICAVTAAMSDGTGLNGFAEKYPKRFFDVGIAEEHAVTFCAGLSAAGMTPVFAVYSTFLQRSYDQILHDAVLQNLPITLCIDRAGLNPGDGLTHHGIYDVAMLNTFDEFEIFAPLTYDDLKKDLAYAVSSGRSVAIRYPSGSERENFISALPYVIDGIGYATTDDFSNVDTFILTYGQIVGEALKACSILRKAGQNASVLCVHQLKPYDRLVAFLKERLPKTVHLIILEEGILDGGFGMKLSELMDEDGGFSRLTKTVFAIRQNVFHSEKGKTLYETLELDGESVAKKCLNS